MNIEKLPPAKQDEFISPWEDPSGNPPLEKPTSSAELNAVIVPLTEAQKAHNRLRRFR
jgi:hypothetical protein